MSGIEGIETCLCFAQRRLQFAGLQHLVGVIGREAERHATVHDVFT